MESDLTKVPSIIRRLYGLVSELEEIFPGRHFTPDGHLVGSIGEVAAAYIFDLDLHPASTKSCDGVAPDGRTVEVKATQGSVVSLTADPTPMPDVLVVMRLHKDGSVDVVYNGPAQRVWSEAGPAQKTGQCRIGFGRLSAIGVGVTDAERLQIVRRIDL